MIRPNFKRADIEKFLKKKLEEIDRQTVARLRVLGEMCVNIARSEGKNYPEAFPVAYVKNGKPLQQRKITQRDKDKSKYVVAPQFGDYINWTGNLTASIAYFIIRDGRIIDEDTGSEEVATSRRIAKKTAQGRKGYVLVIVAGAKYAAAVESKGYDVITSAEQYAKKEAPKILKKLYKG